MKVLRISLLPILFLSPLLSAGGEPPLRKSDTEPIDFYWMGTAITIWHHFPQQISDMLAESMGGREVNFERQYVWPIQQLFLPDDHPKKRGHPSLKKKDDILAYIQEEQPDFVVIQTTYDYFRTGEEARYAGDFPLTIRSIGKAVSEYGGRMVFYESGWNNEKTIAPLRPTLYGLAEEFDAVVVPCRVAQDLFRERHPDLDWSYEGDKRHPGQYFVLLNQMVFYTALIGESPDTVDGTILYRQPDDEIPREERMIEKTIDPEIVESMKEIAVEAVAISQERQAQIKND